jgi:hypothetical protein
MLASLTEDWPAKPAVIVCCGLYWFYCGDSAVLWSAVANRTNNLTRRNAANFSANFMWVGESLGGLKRKDSLSALACLHVGA